MVFVLIFSRARFDEKKFPEIEILFDVKCLLSYRKLNFFRVHTLGWDKMNLMLV
jgi:hypothetical protein